MMYIVYNKRNDEWRSDDVTVSHYSSGLCYAYDTWSMVRGLYNYAIDYLWYDFFFNVLYNVFTLL